MTPRQPSIAVVVPYFGEGPYLREALESILDQTIPVDEIVVVDDASADRPDHPEQLDPRIRVIRHKVNRGAGASRQTGVEATSAEWIAFLDADDAWLETKLERQFADLATKPSLAAHHTGLVTIYADGSQFPRVDKPRLLTLPIQLRRNQAMPSALMVRREVLSAVGGWSSDRRVMEDWELGIRLTNAGHQVGFLPEPLVRFRRTGQGNLSSRGFQHMVINLATVHHHLPLFRRELGWRGTLAVAGRVVHDEGCRRGRLDGFLLRGLGRAVALGGLPQ